MKIAESIYEGIVKTSYKQSTREDATRDCYRRLKRGKVTSSNNYSNIGHIAGNRRKRYVEHPKRMSNTCLIHVHGNSSDECKVLGDLCSKYVKSIPSKYREHDIVPEMFFNRHQDNNAIVKSEVDEILLHKNQKVHADKESPENVGSEFDENKLYQIDNTSIENTKENIELSKRAFGYKPIINTGLKTRMV